MLSLLCAGSFWAAVGGGRPGGSQESPELRVHRAECERATDLQRFSPTPALTIRERGVGGEGDPLGTQETSPGAQEAWDMCVLRTTL